MSGIQKQENQNVDISPELSECRAAWSLIGTRSFVAPSSLSSHAHHRWQRSVRGIFRGRLLYLHLLEVVAVKDNCICKKYLLIFSSNTSHTHHWHRNVKSTRPADIVRDYIICALSPTAVPLNLKSYIIQKRPVEEKRNLAIRLYRRWFCKQMVLTTSARCILMDQI